MNSLSKCFNTPTNEIIISTNYALHKITPNLGLKVKLNCYRFPLINCEKLVLLLTHMCIRLITLLRCDFNRIDKLLIKSDNIVCASNSPQHHTDRQNTQCKTRVIIIAFSSLALIFQLKPNEHRRQHPLFCHANLSSSRWKLRDSEYLR